MENTFAHAIMIMRMRPGQETQRKALELFMAHGPAAGTQWLLASPTAKIYVTLVNLEEWSVTDVATYAPYFDVETIPVCSVDDDWIGAMREAVARQE